MYLLVMENSLLLSFSHLVSLLLKIEIPSLYMCNLYAEIFIHMDQIPRNVL